MNSSIERHIFISDFLDEVLELYLNKSDEFHKYFVEDLIIDGSKDELNLNKNKKYNGSFYQKIVDCLESFEHLIEIVHYNIEASITKSKIFYINSDEYVEGFYLLETFKDLAIDQSSSFQIFKMRDVNLISINNFWLE